MGHPLLAILLVVAAWLPAADSDYQSYNNNAFFGIDMGPTSTGAQDRNGIGPNVGVQVHNVYPDTAANRSGVQPGDVVIDVNGAPVNSMTDMRNEVGLSSPGDPVRVTVMRDGRALVLGDRFSEWPANIPRDPIDAAAEKRFRDWQGERLNKARERVADLDRKVKQLEAGSPADQAQLRRDPLRQGPASQALAVVPAWQVRVHLTQQDAKPPAELVDVDAPIQPAAAVPPWRFSWKPVL